MNRWVKILLLGGALWSTGCSRLSTDYGESKGYQGRNSLNGFGALRRSFEQAGFRSRDVTRLGDRVRRSDVIVWTPTLLAPIDDSVTKWFDRWLRQGNRTLVYIVPDSGSEADYWMEAAKLASPQQGLEYRRRSGRSINERFQWRLNRFEVPSNGWLRIEPIFDRRRVDQLAGPWANELESLAPESDTNPAPRASLHEVEFTLAPYDKDAGEASNTSAAVNAGFGTGPTGPSAAGWFLPATVQTTKTPVEFTPLLLLDQDQAIVAEIRSSQWRDSKILVVAGGSLLTNYAFSREANRRLADKLIAETSATAPPEALVGFLTSDWQGVSVSDREPNAPQTTGMEMLTEWPISIVTMHGLVLGLLVCLMLLPIFGRPRQLRRAEANDIGHHLDAVAALMQRTGGEGYARGRISDYFKRMHGETSGPWVVPDRHPSAATPSLSRPGGKPLTSSVDASIPGEPHPVPCDSEKSPPTEGRPVQGEADR